MLQKLALSVCWAVGVTLGCILLAVVLALLNVNIATVVSEFIARFSTVIGVLSGLWYFFTH